MEFGSGVWSLSKVCRVKEDVDGIWVEIDRFGVNIDGKGWR